MRTLCKVKKPQSHKDKSIETESPLIVVWGWEEWESCGTVVKRSRVSFGADEDVLKLIAVMVANSVNYTKSH